VAVDASHLYWGDVRTGAGVVEANPDGTGAHGIASDPNGPLWVAVDASHLYWTDLDTGRIVETNLDGTGAHGIASDPNRTLGVAVGP